MNEDRRRNRAGYGPENLAPMSRPAPIIARCEPGKNAMRGKLERAGRNDNFMLDLIRAAANQTRRTKSDCPGCTLTKVTAVPT